MKRRALAKIAGTELSAIGGAYASIRSRRISGAHVIAPCSFHCSISVEIIVIWWMKLGVINDKVMLRMGVRTEGA